MAPKLTRWILIASVAAIALCAPRATIGEDRLIWHAKGSIQSISSGTLTVNRFEYKLTPSTVYEKDDRTTTLSAFTVGDFVKITFLTDRSVLEVEAETPREDAPSATPTPTPAATPNVNKFTTVLTQLGTSTAKGQSGASYGATESKFALNVKIPRNTIPLATTIAEARELSITALITRDGDLVATCTAALDPKRKKKSIFEYKTEIERKNRAGARKARSKHGRCILANGSAGLPNVRAGDVVSVSEAVAGEFLRGQYRTRQ
jgi:hypothetical protein